MFRSVFTKYITAFMLIIIISFTILATIISTMVTNYSMKTKEEFVVRAGDIAKTIVEEDYTSSGIVNFHDYAVINQTLLERNLTMVAHYTDDLYIFITDENGTLLLTDETVDRSSIGAIIPAAALNTIFGNGELKMLTDLDGTLPTRHLVYAVPIYSEEATVVGSVFCCASSVGLTEFVEVMIKTIITTSLWVLLASLIAVYFISERIIAPLKNMSRAAKSFAAGKFDVRVPVTGRDEVAELAVAFNNMASSLAGIEDMRRSFLANVSHDLRTPMTTISGFIENILAGAVPPDKVDYYLNIISGEVHRLSRLVSSLLDISRIQAGDRKFNMEAFDICELARQILLSFEQKIDDKKLDVSFDCDEDNMFVYADRDAIHQILYNICDNGIKFSRIGGKYRIKLTARDKKVYVSVYNEGDGIPEEDIPYIFDRFYKSDKSRGLDKTGVGLGLYIAKTIIEAHHEEIWVKSVYGEYCEFVFTLSHIRDIPVKGKQ